MILSRKRVVYEKNLQVGFKLIKNITKKIEYYSGFEYVIKLVDVVADTENKTYLTFASEEGKKLVKEWGVPDNYICQAFVILGYIDGEQPHSKPRKPGRIQIVE